MNLISHGSQYEAYSEGVDGKGFVWTCGLSTTLHRSIQSEMDPIAVDTVVIVERKVRKATAHSALSLWDGAGQVEGKQQEEADDGEEEVRLEKRRVVKVLDRMRYELDKAVDWSPEAESEWYWQTVLATGARADPSTMVMTSGRIFKYTLPCPPLVIGNDDWRLVYSFDGVKDKLGWAHGDGVCTYDDGTVYRGGFKKGKRHGQGTIKFANGSSYEGGWWCNQQHGQGRFDCAPGSKGKGGWAYTGEWRCGMRVGSGVISDGTSSGSYKIELADELDAAEKSAHGPGPKATFPGKNAVIHRRKYLYSHYLEEQKQLQQL
jgi:hypothetical protein